MTRSKTSAVAVFLCIDADICTELLHGLHVGNSIFVSVVWKTGTWETGKPNWSDRLVNSSSNRLQIDLWIFESTCFFFLSIKHTSLKRKLQRPVLPENYIHISLVSSQWFATTENVKKNCQILIRKLLVFKGYLLMFLHLLGHVWF